MEEVGGVGSSEEVVGGRAELEVVVDVGFLGERVAEAGDWRGRCG